VLREARVETRRELAPFRADVASAEDVVDLGVRPGTPVFERTYSIVSHAQRLATITERVPATLFEDVA
jgi:chorismate-pyruvate lyase